MLIDSGPGLAVILVGSLLALLLIGTVVVFSYRRCRQRVNRDKDNTSGSTERAATGTQNEAISPVTIYYGETWIQPRQLTRGMDQSLSPDESSIGRLVRNFPAGGPVVTAAAGEAAFSSVAATFAANISALTRRDSLQLSSITAVAGAPVNGKLPSHSKHPGETAADTSRTLTTAFTKSLATTAEAERAPPRRSLAVDAIPVEHSEHSSGVAHAKRASRDGRSSDERQVSDINVRSPSNFTENDAVRFVTTADATEEYVESQRRSSAWSIPAGAGANPGMQRPLPLPPTELRGSRLETSQMSSGYVDDANSSFFFATDADRSRRESSKSDMSLPLPAVQQWQANSGRFLPRTSWSGPALPTQLF